MTIQWRRADETAWKRVVNPELVTVHDFLLTDLEHGKTYQIRIACRNADGRAGLLQSDYTYTDPESAR